MADACINSRESTTVGRAEASRMVGYKSHASFPTISEIQARRVDLGVNLRLQVHDFLFTTRERIRNHENKARLILR